MYEEELFLLSKPLRLFFLQLCKRSLYTHQQHPSLRGRKIFQVIRTSVQRWREKQRILCAPLSLL